MSTSSSDLDAVRRGILATVVDIHHLTAGLYAKGIDARDPTDREAFDIVCRIERRLMAKGDAPKKKTVTEPA
jgi:hypothetical protein